MGMESSLARFQSLAQPAGAVEFFRGLFERVGVRVTDTGEQVTGKHLGDRVAFEGDLDPNSVDYVVEVPSTHIDRLADHLRAGTLDELEQYRIASALFTPATAAMLKNPIMSQPSLRKLAGVEDLIHVHLKSPAVEAPDTAHTLIYANRQWIVLPGLHGIPARVYRLNTAQALDYQRKALEALKANNLSAWTAFAGWYREWRKGVSSTT